MARVADENCADTVHHYDGSESQEDIRKRVHGLIAELQGLYAAPFPRTQEFMDGLLKVSKTLQSEFQKLQIDVENASPKTIIYFCYPPSDEHIAFLNELFKKLVHIYSDTEVKMLDVYSVGRSWEQIAYVTEMLADPQVKIVINMDPIYSMSRWEGAMYNMCKGLISGQRQKTNSDNFILLIPPCIEKIPFYEEAELPEKGTNGDFFSEEYHRKYKERRAVFRKNYEYREYKEFFRTNPSPIHSLVVDLPDGGLDIERWVPGAIDRILELLG